MRLLKINSWRAGNQKQKAVIGALLPLDSTPMPDDAWPVVLDGVKRLVAQINATFPKGDRLEVSESLEHPMKAAIVMDSADKWGSPRYVADFSLQPLMPHMSTEVFSRHIGSTITMLKNELP